MKPLRTLLITQVTLAGLMFAPVFCASAEPTNFWTEDVWQAPERGFLFYGPEAPVKRKGPRQTPLDSLTTLAALQAEARARLEAAVMEPTEANIRAYLEVNHFMLTKSQDFSEAWKKALWRNPAFDETVRYPKANFAQVMLKDHRREALNRHIDAIKSRVALVFVIQAHCPYCEMMAPIAKALAARGLSVLAVYRGNVKPEAWANAKPDNGFLQNLTHKARVTLTQTPALFAVSETGEAQLMASGALAVDEIIERLATITGFDANAVSTVSTVSTVSAFRTPSADLSFVKEPNP